MGHVGTTRALHSGTGLMTSHLNRACDQKEDSAFEKILDPIAGSPATEKSVARNMILFVDDLFGGGNGTRRSQSKRTRRKISTVPLQCIQGIEALLDR